MKKVLNILGRVLKGAGDASTGGVVSAVLNAKNSPDGGKGIVVLRYKYQN